MKKLIAAMAALAMLAAISTTAFAASVPITAGTPATATAPVQTTTTQTDSYSATIDWGAMAFAYDFGIWDPATHTWGGAGWVAAGFAGTNDAITVKNDSSQPITADFAYLANGEGTNNNVATTGSFTTTSGNLNGDTDQTGKMAIALYPVDGPAPSGTTYLNLQGPPAASIGSLGVIAEHTIGNITVTLNSVS
jgi:hypothetical protein